MKRTKSLLIFMLLALLSGSAWAQCTEQTITASSSFYENFDNWAHNSSNAHEDSYDLFSDYENQHCWYVSNEFMSYGGNTASPNYTPRIWNGSGRHLSLRSGGTTHNNDPAYDNVVAMPVFSNPLSELTLSFEVKLNQTKSCKFKVGYVNDNDNSFTMLTEFDYNKNIFNTKTFRLSDYSNCPTEYNEHYRIAFCFPSPTADDNISCDVDEIHVTLSQYTITGTTNGNGTVTVSNGGTCYAGGTATLTATANEGYHFHQWSDGNTDNPRTISNVTADATYTAEFTTIPYIIANATDWEAFCETVKNGHYYSGETVKLANDIEIDRMVGENSNSILFSGTFDGQSHTITFNYENATAEYTAPFRYINGATIKNVKVTGAVSSSQRFAGGIVAYAKGTSTVTNCINSTDITSTGNTHGGIVGMVGGKGTINITGCVFNGTMTNGTDWSGILGLNNTNCTANISDCLFDPASVNVSSTSGTVLRNNGKAANLSNCYYTHVMSTINTNSTQVYPITLAANPTEGGTMTHSGFAVTTYDVSNVTTYGAGNGLDCGGIFYAPTGDYTLTATANVGYIFANWTKDGAVVSTNPTYSFTVSEAASYTATFTAVSAASIPFTDDFETDKGWTLVNGGLTNQWHRGTAEGGHKDGEYGLYISKDNGTTNTYDMDKAAMVYAYQWFYFEAGNYSISYDWKCKGQSTWDFLRVALVPSSYELVAGDAMPSDFGTTSLPTGWIAADGGHKLNLLGTWATEQTDRIFIVNVANAGYYRLAFCWRNDGSGGENPPAAIDNVAVRKANTFSNNSGNGNGYWNLTANWSLGTVPTIDEDVIISGTCKVPDGCVAKANAITIQSGNITIEDGGQLKHNSGNVAVTMEKSITGYGESTGKDHYYFIASPATNSTAASNYTNLINDDATTFAFYTFDYDNEVSGQLLEWKRENGNTYIIRGNGYLYANQSDCTITTPSITVAPSNGTVDVNLSYDANGTWRFNGWNIIGNPFACNATVSSGISYYVINGSELKAATSNVIVPMQGIFAKATGANQSVTFSRATEESNNNSTSSVNLYLKPADTRDAKVIDAARVRFDEGEGLEKFQLNPNHTKIYIPQNGTDYAVVHTQAEGELPLNLKVEENGRYTLSVDIEKVSFDYLHLIDNMTGADIDLLAGASTGSAAYTFSAKTTDYASRFKLVFAADTEDDATTGSETFAYFNGSEWNIANNGDATLQVVDMMGRVLSSEQINGSTTKAINAAQGIYMLRLVNGENVKVQKIVVR